MSRKDKIEVIKRLLEKGLRESAEVACFDWGIDINAVIRD